MPGTDLLAFAATAFVTLLVTIGPVETAAVYAMLTSGIHRPDRGRLAWRCVVIAGMLLFAFAFAGNPVLSLMHVSPPAFRFAAGVMLFLQAINLVFGAPGGLSSINAAEESEALKPRDIAVFPLAFPLIAGPGSLTAVVVLAAGSDAARMAVLLGALLVCLALTYLALMIAERLGRILGVTGTDVVGRVSGILLAALAAQFMFDGLHEAGVLG
jgi:multiple antibiotic resistance protein